MQTPSKPVEEGSTARVAPLEDRQLAHGVLRLVVGLNILVHGLVRVGAPGAFADGIVQGFASTPLPEWSVRPFALVLPFAELAVGLLILLGLKLRLALVAGGVLIAMLTFGESLRQQWNTVGLQLIYALAYSALLARASDARFTVDGLLAGRRAR
ncbi:DoxX family membrane protein [Myxococcus sp. K15C18031901]|uniref:MauE/DoxX family redox-associated membrane protein n=1 Tax=Myxococcus dinghuensis TaxID=2906761 RepID=UPI0020A727CB|nr:DoxX family membrane protein [Myxococcus dinghuensis]MCP3098301.1 DoxX family membrane protein [Myxococcus dinghuensis]